MNILIDNKSGEPIYNQIYSQIKNQIISGELKEDEMLPSIRGLAKDLRISFITTKRAYEELEKEGFIYTLPAKGCYVAPKNVELLREENPKECSNYCTIALISHATKVMLKTLQVRLQWYMNHEFPDVQAGFREGRRTRDQIANIHWIITKARVPEKHLLLH